MSLSTNAPLFIVGVGRSGTTLLSLMIDSHSKLAIPYESNFFVRFYQEIDRFGDLNQEANRKAMVQEILKQVTITRWDYAPTLENIDLDRCTTFPGAIAEIYGLYAKHLGKQFWGDKSPGYTPHMDVINELFPNAYFIHLIRDGRDVTTSTLNQGWWSASDFTTTIRGWRRDVHQARAFLNRLPSERWLEVRYEDLVSNPQPIIERICTMLDLPFEPSMLEAYSQNARRKVKDMVDGEHAKLLNKPSASNAYKWRQSLPQTDQAIAEAEAGDLLKELGYPAGTHQHALSGLRRLYHMSVRFRRALRRRLILLKNGGRKRPYLYHAGTSYQA